MFRVQNSLTLLPRELKSKTVHPCNDMASIKASIRPPGNDRTYLNFADWSYLFQTVFVIDRDCIKDLGLIAAAFMLGRVEGPFLSRQKQTHVQYRIN